MSDAVSTAEGRLADPAREGQEADDMQPAEQVGDRDRSRRGSG